MDLRRSLDIYTPESPRVTSCQAKWTAKYYTRHSIEVIKFWTDYVMQTTLNETCNL